MAKKGKKKKNKPLHIPKEQTASRNSARSTDAIVVVEADADSQDYAEMLLNIITTWRGLVRDARKRAELSLSDIVSGEETRPAFEALKSTVIGFGIRLSRIIVEYFAVIWRCNSKEVWVKTRNAANTIRKASLEDDDALSAIVSAFVASIELIDFDNEEKRHLCNESGCYCRTREDEVRVSETENKILGTIFFRVLFLEILFDLPFLSGGAAGKENCATRISEFVAKQSGFEEKLRSLESEIERWMEAEIREEGIDFRGENMETKKATVGFKIEEIWKSLS